MSTGPDHQAAEHKPTRQRETQRSSTNPGLEGLAPPENLPIPLGTLLRDSRLSGRGNTPVHAAAMRQAQRTYGNRAVQRYLQQKATARAAAPAPLVQHDASPQISAPGASAAVEPDNPHQVETGPGSDQAGGQEAAPMVQTSPAPVAPSEVQRQDAPAPGPGPVATTVQGLIVDDSVTQADLVPGQMRRSAFLVQARAAVEQAANTALAGAPDADQAHAEVERQFGQYSGLDGAALERTLRQEVPEAARATTAEQLLAGITTRAQQTIQGQVAQSGGVTGTLVAGAAAVGSALQSAVGAAAGFIGALFKTRPGGIRDTGASAPAAGLGRDGATIPGHLRSGLETAYGADFSQVRVHTDPRATALSDSVNARAFTIGQDIAFGTGEYQPGTLVGDALIAHEVAHVVQQGQGTAAGMQQKGASNEVGLEEDADRAAVGAVAALWGGTTQGLAQVSENAMPRRRSGLRLQRCNGKSSTTAPAALAPRLRTLLAGTGAVDVKATIAAIHAASRADREAVIADGALMDSIRNRTGNDAVIVISALFEGTHVWVNPPASDFFKYFVVNNGTGSLPNTASMNCWESIMYAAYLAHKVSPAWIKAFYTNALNSGADPNVAVWAALGWSTALPTYPGTRPAGGQLLFYHTGGAIPGHVALSLGGNDAMSLWSQPNNVNSIQRIAVTDLAGTVHVGNPPW